MKKIHFIISLLFMCSLFALNACNTMEGLGQDIKAGGESLERSADRNRKY